MSLTTIARHVRDPALPHRRRVSALRSGTRLYCPIGFPATLSFLDELAGPHSTRSAAGAGSGSPPWWPGTIPARGKSTQR